MKRIFPILLMLTFSLHEKISAQFYSLDVFQTIDGYWNSYKQFVYDTTYENRIIGGVSLKSVTIELKPHGSYLEVTEEAVISAQGLNSNSLGKLWIEGNIRVPKKSTIVSLYFKNDSAGYSGVIHPTYKKGNPVDTTLGNALATLSWNANADELTNSYNSNADVYTLKLFQIVPGKEYRVTIHYFVPNTGNANPQYQLQVLFHSTTAKPGVIDLLFSSDSLSRPFVLAVNKSKFQLSKHQSLQVPYQQSFELIATDTIETSMHITSIDSGNWSGKYLLLNTIIPDSVISKLSKSIELVVLWRWNRPSSFVRKSTANSKYLSGYGGQAVSQAVAIRQLVNEIISTGNRSGLVHSIQYRQPEVFPLCQKISSAYAKLDNYLGQFNDDYFLNSGYFEIDTKPENPPDTNPGPIDSSRVEFLQSLTYVNGLYSNGNGILKHLVIVSCGPVQISRNLVTMEEIDTLLRTISVDCSTPVWRDVNFSLVNNVSAVKTLVPFGEFYLPEFRPASMILQVSNETRIYSFPIAANQASFSIIAKSDRVWKNQLSWTGCWVSGDTIGTVKSFSSVISSPSDTGLVKLWAANNERLSEINEPYLSLKYGVVSENSSMKIFPSYKGYDSTATAYAPISNLYASDTTVPISGSMSPFTSTNTIFCYTSRNILRVMLPWNMPVKKIQIYLLSGQLLVEFCPGRFFTKEGYQIPLSFLARAIKTNLIIVRICGEDKIITRKLVL